MAKWQLKIWVDGANADEGTNPMASAISNLEYDGYEVTYWEEGLEIE